MKMDTPKIYLSNSKGLIDKLVKDTLDELVCKLPIDFPSLYIKENLEKALSEYYGLEISDPRLGALLEVIMARIEHI